MTDQLCALQQLLSLSRLMLEKAREEVWDEVFVLEAERSESIKFFFAEPIRPENSEAVGAAIQTILARDRDTMALGSLAKLDLAQALHTIEQGKKAVRAYNL